MNGTKLTGIIGHVNKELEALNLLSNYANDCHHFGEFEIEYRLVLKALQRLETIDNANPSEALECLERLDNVEFSEFNNNLSDDFPQWFNPIKQALVKSQEQEKENADYKKVLEILKEKRVNVDLFWNDFVDNGFGYHYYLEKWYKYQSNDSKQLTEEEFDLVKRYFK